MNWLFVPNSTTLPDGSSGVWIAESAQIILAEAATHSPSLIRHEMLHAILGEHGHPAAQFLERCDGIVSCDAICQTDAGGRVSVAESAAALAPQELQTEAEVYPAAPSVDSYGGAMSVVVTITNPRTEDVWVQLERDAVGPVSQTFGVLYDAGDPAVPLRGRSIGTADVRFALRAGEKRRYVFDETARLGTLGIRGLFNRDTSARVVVQVK